ncbi:MAG: hypothetical protein KatS3mg082_0899 [Nitrospiraceae bacterium]|nr:MAG: hypothetical protein KatS3mg082_0899 [Nitrospiraceae bacterium]
MKIPSLLRLVVVAVVVAGSFSGQAAAPLAKATFAGGCFWCMEEVFEAVDGVVSVTSGYTGGQQAYPSYEDVSAGGTGHAEAVEIAYDPSRVSYEKLLQVFWRNIDPTTPDRQFCDKGHQYRSAIFYHDETPAQAGGGIEAGGGKNQDVQRADRHRDRSGLGVLSSRRLPSRFLQEESHPLQVL